MTRLKGEFMTKDLIVPELGENIASAQVVNIPVSAGDTVSQGQCVLEIETGKATLELPADYAGVIEQILVAVGDECGVGTAFATLQVKEAAAVAASDAAAAAETQASDKAEATGNAEAAGDAAAAGDAVAAGDAAAAGEAQASGDAEAAGDAEAKTEAPGKAAAAKGRATPAADQPDKSAPPRPVLPSSLPAPGHHVPAAPSVRRFARELGVNIDTVKGSGKHGRVSIDDVKKHVRERQGAITPGATGLPLPPLPDFAKWGGIRTEKMSGIRIATAEHVSQCWINIPRVTHFDEANITKLEALRQKYASRAEGSGGKLTMAVMVVKAVSLALKKFPKFNASVDMAARKIIFKEYVNIGIAVATERGLMVPVIPAADRKNMIELAGAIGVIAAKCRDGKIKPAELEGGTFTVTNLGGIGGSYFTPIVNFPEVAILGLGRAFEQLTLVDGKPVAQTKLPLSLSYDHRLIDGADAAAFVKWIVEAVEEPLLLALEG